MPDLPDTAATPVRPVTDPAGWHAGDLDNANGWVYRLTAADINEIDDAVRAIETAGIKIAEITETDFAFPSLDARLREIGHEIVHGRGVALIKGVPVDRYTRRQAAAAYWGIGLRIGVPVSQNGKGHVLGHVKKPDGRRLRNVHPSRISHQRRSSGACGFLRCGWPDLPADLEIGRR